MRIRFGRLKIRQKLQLGFGVLILLICGLAVVLTRSNLEVRDGYELVTDDTFFVVSNLGQAELKGARIVESTSELVQKLLVEHKELTAAGSAGAGDTAALVAALGPDEFAEMKAEIEEQQDGLRQNLQEFSEHESDFDGDESSDDAKEAIERRDQIVGAGQAVLEASGAVVSLIDSGADLSVILSAQQRMTDADPTFFSRIESALGEERTELVERRDETHDLINEMTEMLLGAAAGALLFGLGVSLLIADRIATPIAQLREAAAKIGAGDFSAGELAAKIKSGDEVGDLAGAFTKMAADLDNANVKLARNQRLSMLGQVAGTVSHELRNPLGAIRASLAVFKKLCAGKGLGVERALERAERSVGRCDGIISDLLEYTRNRDMARQPADFDKLIGEQLDEHALPTAVSLKRELNGGCTVAVDRDRFRQVLVNLLDNAAQAMTDPGWTPPEGRERTITVRTETAGPHCRLSVIDTGPGIPEQALAKIFEPLFTTKNFGVGLGLPTVQKIVEAHGGTIGVERTGPGGTEFVAWLPRQQADQPVAEANQPAARHAAA
jgi:signal transduction histidine kinase